jgi:hypothetical protein
MHFREEQEAARGRRFTRGWFGRRRYVGEAEEDGYEAQVELVLSAPGVVSVYKRSLSTAQCVDVERYHEHNTSALDCTVKHQDLSTCMTIVKQCCYPIHWSYPAA